ncbi:MAG: ABC transporter substrate-binding protein [Gammaproteobacteria bacterium]|nr:ABC transporter substrate-binding protein [Gammaproteobacteria bacterium]
MIIALKTRCHIITLIFILGLSAGCNKNETPLRLAHIGWPGYETLTLAKTKGLYNNLEVTLYRPSNTTDTMLSLQNNIVDVAAISLNSLIKFQHSIDEPLVIIAVLDISHGVDVIIANSEINSIKHLKGKRLGMEPTALGAFFVLKAIESSTEIDLNQVQLLPITIENHKNMFLSGKIDAIATYAPAASEILKKKGHVIFDSSRIPNQIVDVLITRESYASQHPDKIKKLLNGYFNAIEFTKSQPDHAIAEMAKIENIEPFQYKKSLEGIHIPDLDSNYALLDGEESKLKSTMENIKTVLEANNIINLENDTLPNINSDFLPENNKKLRP